MCRCPNLSIVFGIRNSGELTGGTKPMCIGAYEISKEKHLRTLYVPEGKKHEAKDLLNGSSVDLKHKLTTAEFLEGYGFA